MLKQFNFEDIKNKAQIEVNKMKKIQIQNPLKDSNTNLNQTTAKMFRAHQFSTVTVKEDQIADESHRIAQLQATISVV